MKSHKPNHPLFASIASLALGMASAHAVPIGIRAVADHWVSENSITGGVPGNPLDVPDGQGAAASPVLQVRYGTERNEAAVLRFDLTGQNRAIIAGASVRLINYAVNGSHTLHFYGVVDGTTGFNAITSTAGTATDDNWPEDTTTYSTTPGLTYDADSTTRGLDFVGTVDLGTRAIGSDTAEGAAVVFTSAALTDFIINHPDDVVTILVTADTNNTGVKRFASREATTLTAGGTPQPAGTYAPTLLLDLPGQRIVASADREFNEQNNGASAGNSGTANVRYVNAVPGNNEIIALRFDMTGYDPSDILSAEVRLTNFRDNNATPLMRFHGVLDEATGFNSLTSTEGTFTDDNWPEDAAMTFAEVPGVSYDGNTSTPGADPARTVDLGTVAMSDGAGNRLMGTKVAMATPALVDFLKNHPDNVVTILVSTTTASSGQKRFTTKEATQLNTGDPQPAGTYAPELNLLMSNPDRDGDGLLNTWEVAHSYDPDDADSDNDGTNDGLEDPDLDNLVNTGEQTRGTHPNDPDTDDDGLTDLVETKTGTWGGATDTGTNPLVADSDSDSLLDGVENPDLPFVDANQTGSDPNLVDTDGDIYPDGGEVARNSSPADFNVVPNGAVLELLGTGTGALEFGPLTDPDWDIVDNTSAGANFNWASISSLPAKNFFGTGSFGVDPDNMSGACDLFDNKVGGANDNNDKWLAGGVTAVGGVHVTVEFPGTVSLATFNIASANDRPERDPVDWQILGSTDGENFTPIFTQTDPGNLALWKLRGQVIKCTLAAPTAQYRYLRFACTRAGQGEGTAHVYELQYFGTLTPDAPSSDFRITGFTGGPGTGDISLTWTSQPGDTYRIAYSTSLADGFTSTAASNIPAGAGGTTTHSFPNPLPAAPRLFFRVEKP
jgi:hypothetical protein